MVWVRKMKPFDVIRTASLRGVLLKKVLGIAAAYGLLSVIGLVLLADYGRGTAKPGIFDLVADLSGVHGATNQNMFIIFGIPFIVTVLTLIYDEHEKSLYVLKCRSRFCTWHAHVWVAIGISFLLACFVVAVSFMAGLCLVGPENTWARADGTIAQALRDRQLFQSISDHLAAYKIIWVIFITKFLGFLMIAFSTLFLKQFIKSGAVICILLLAIAGIDYVEWLPFPVFDRAASLSLIDWIRPLVTFYHGVYLLVTSLMLYVITGMIYERKDFLS